VVPFPGLVDVGKTGTKSGPKNDSKRDQNEASNGPRPNERVNTRKRRQISTYETERLTVSETVYRGEKSWRVTMGKRGKNLLSFRVRPDKSGFGVTWRTAGREPYVCYLSAQKWQSLKRQANTRSFARTIADKIEQRIASGDVAAGKLDGLLGQLKTFC
jgi:hypothetical protein